MTDRELMQQALDAMLNFPNDISDDMFESIRVLRARLAQPEQEPPCKTGSQCVGGKCERCAVQEWQGLTDEEMHECAGEYPWTPTGLKCCRAIEAKLKEKNA